MSFESLSLSPKLLKALKDKGYENSTQIQKELIPAIFSGRDILSSSQTGSGKTAGFALPILQELDKEYEQKQIIKAVVIAPTRELAKQIYKSFLDYGKYLPLKSIALFGGSNKNSQKKALEEGVDIIIGTSGRLLEHIKEKNLSVKSVKYLVLDEADTILDMGFINEVAQILEHLPDTRQNILISATLSGSVKRLADRILTRPKLIEVDSLGTTAKSVKQVIIPVEKERKNELLSYIIGSRNYRQVLVFVRKKGEADEVEKELNQSGLKTLVIHGDKTSGARSRALNEFKEGRVQVLVATDIAARGLDIPTLKVVINYDLPHVVGDYIHRIGRTGRAGVEGLAITLISPKEEIALRDVEQMLGKKIDREILQEYKPDVSEIKKASRKKSKEIKKVDGAFGKKKKTTVKKKRKVTKRDGWSKR